MRHPVPTTVRTAAALLLASSLIACTTTVSGRPVTGDSGVTKTDPGTSGVDPSFVHNTDGGEIDRLAATVVTDVENYWEETFPQTFGSDWQPLAGGYYSVDTAHADAKPPPCVQLATDVEGNAFYCPSEDVIAWDRAALLPVLRDEFGEAAVMLVLAHEIGHAVQQRSGVGLGQQRADPQRYPTILLEAMADCYAGAFVRWVADGNAGHLQIQREQLDSALEALIIFRDPIGTEQTDQGAHGDAFDRVSAFQDGFNEGAQLCAGMTVDNRVFTQRGFIDPGDAQRGGNLEFDQIFESMETLLNDYFGALVSEQGSTWDKPEIRPLEGEPGCGGAEQGPIAFCPGGEIDVSTTGELPELHTDIGDYATGTLLASRFGMAAISAIGAPTEGKAAQHDVLCLAGAFTGALLVQQQQVLSPGDLDEAVQVLLEYDYASRDDTGAAIPTGFERVSVFRTGTLNGPEACELP